MKTTTTMTTIHGKVVMIDWDGEAVLSVTLFGRTLTESYLDTVNHRIVFGASNTPCGVLLTLSRSQVEEIALCGGRIDLYADDLYGLDILPQWWNIECQMVSEGDAPAWPLSEDRTGGATEDTGGLIAGLLSALIDYNDEDEGDFI
jgi:hypothetical protein